MFTLLCRLFIRDYKATDKPEVRRAYGRLCALAAIGLNILLVVAKFIAAGISGSFSVKADAINNLTDTGSGLLLLLVFALAGMKPQPDRPFGHGRIEYIGGFIVSALILLCAFETGRDAVLHILHPAEISFSWVTPGVLAGSIAVKFYMSFFTLKAAKAIRSDTLRATGLDNLTDTISTGATLAGLLLYRFTPNHLNLDGYLGFFVALVILKAGLESAKATLGHLLGTTPDPEVVEKVTQICRRHPEVCGLHDLVIHDYGPGRLHISVHCEVPGNRDIFELHDAMDDIMREMDEEIGCISVVHMDPICVDDGRTSVMRRQLAQALAPWGSNVTIHDFRIVPGPTHTNVIFDCVVPLTVEKDEAKAADAIRAVVRQLWSDAVPIVKIDRPFA